MGRRKREQIMPTMSYYCAHHILTTEGPFKTTKAANDRLKAWAATLGCHARYFPKAALERMGVLLKKDA